MRRANGVCLDRPASFRLRMGRYGGQARLRLRGGREAFGL
jgi:hypothetical protein